MSFYGSSFSFDGISCEEYGLMLYDFNNTGMKASEFTTGMDVIEDRLPQRARSLFYGTGYKDPLEFTLVFGVADSSEPIDRQEMEVLASWLTEHDDYKWLTIDQEDMVGIRYRCIMTDLKMLEFAGDKWALSCEVHCDSPFAYTMPEKFSYTVNGTADVVLHSRSSSNRPYYPPTTIALNGSGDFSVVNHSDGNYETKFTGVPQTSDIIDIDSENGIITTSHGLNVYPNFNFKFPRLVRGDNHLTITGKGTIVFVCEFPVNVGG